MISKTVSEIFLKKRSVCVFPANRGKFPRVNQMGKPGLSVDRGSVPVTETSRPGPVSKDLE